MARKAISNNRKDYPKIKADFAEDMATGDYSRVYDVPKAVKLMGAKWESKKDRYFKMLCNGDKSLDGIKSLLIADNIRDTQIEKILAELEERYKEYKAVDLIDLAKRLLKVEQLPSKWTIDRKTGNLITVYPSPLLDQEGHLYAVNYTSKPVNWRAELPTELAIEIYELEHTLYIDGVQISANPEYWGEKEYLLLASKERPHGFYAELAEYLGYTPEEFSLYTARLYPYKNVGGRRKPVP